MSQKKKALILTIPEPCGENFKEMVPVKGGKFCGACEKTIVDFRKMNDYEILRFYEKNKGKICGVFNKVQLNKAMPFPMEAKPSRNWKAVAALAAGLMFSGGLAAQHTTPKMGKVAVVEQDMIKGEVAEDNDSTTPNHRVKGQVFDANKEPLIGVNIIIEGTEIGTTTDLDGFFEIAIPNNLKEVELTISYTGYESQTLLFNEKYPIPANKIDIELVSPSDIGEVMIMGIMIAHHDEAPVVCREEIVEVEAISEIVPTEKVEKGILADGQMTVFPNPFISDFKVSYNYAVKGDYLFHLYDRSGRLLFAKSFHLQKGEQTVQLDIYIPNLMDGVYILQISDKTDRILATKKVFRGQA